MKILLQYKQQEQTVNQLKKNLIKVNGIPLS